MIRKAFVLPILAIAVAGCAWHSKMGLSPETLSREASAWPLEIEEGRVLTDNDAAFLSKLHMIEGAKTSIDMSYYIFSDDHSSSALTKALLEAARRGVAVRLLVDYETNYSRLDLFSMLEKEGNGNIRVRFYNRPTGNIVKDAVFMSMGCSKESAPARPTECSSEKFAAIDKLFADEKIDGVSTAGRNISNLNVGNSGLFLSGLYSKRGDVVALAAQKGQGIDVNQIKGQGTTMSPEEKERLKRLGKDYLEAKTGNAFQRLTSSTELFFAFANYGQQLNPLKETVTSILPVDRKLGPNEMRDWDHFTDYTHHKFLLVDRRTLQMGGRNIENSYHMHPNSLVSKYVFMDTDVRATLSQGGDAVTRTFEDLWNFSDMVATLAEVRQHAPNDFVVNTRYAERQCSAEKDEAEREACVAREMQTNVRDLSDRMADSLRTMEENARIYSSEYLPALPTPSAAEFSVDKGAVLAYLENLPFDKELPAEKRHRTYGALAGEEGKGGKHIFDAWLQEMPGVCAAATPANPKRIILHNAYFFPAANFTYQLSRLVNGDYDCSNVTVTVLTNSIDTTDLNVVNIAANLSIKAFTDFYEHSSDPAKRAKFEYYEYQKPGEGPNLSLHSKVSVFGDDVIIGSANADVRSFMMDTNNAMLIRNAPGFVRDYLAFVDGILSSQPLRVRRQNDYYLHTTKDDIMKDALATFRGILTKYGEDKKLDEKKRKELESYFIQMLNDAYTMTRDAIATDRSARERREMQDKFNEKFKPI